MARQSANRKTNSMKNEIKYIAESLINRDLITEDGMSISEIENVEKKLGCKIPTILKEFYNLVGNLDMFMSAFQDFPEPYLLGEKIVFLEENQGVCYWGINKDNVSELPTVYVCTDIETENFEWNSEDVNLREFLNIIMYLQCAEGGYEYGSAVYESDFENRETYEKFLSDKTVGWEKVVDHNGFVSYQKGDKLIWHFSNSEGKMEDTLYASTLTEESMTELELLGFNEL